jgi:hypothetical protein
MEGETRAAHGSGVYRQNDRLAVASADAVSGFDVGREVDVVAGHFLEAISHDRIEESSGGAMVEDGRRLGRLQLQVNRDAVALVGTDKDPCGVEGETLLVVARYHFLKLGPGDGHSIT